MIHGSLLRPEGCPPAWDEGGLGDAARYGDVHVLSDAWLDDRDLLAGKLDIEAALVTDAWLIAAAWCRWGEDCCDHLLGDFAFALWDGSRHQMMVARDPAGTRPMNYYADSSRVVFSSDLDRLLASPGVPRELDESMLAAQLLRPHCFMPAVNERTCWRNVRKLPPGHRLMISANGLRCERWCRWDECREIRLRRSEDYAEALAERLERAVGRCLTRHEKVASHMSGGMDCSTIAVLASRQLRARGQTLAAGYTWFAPPDAFGSKGDDAYGLVTNLANELAVPLHSAAPVPVESLAAQAATDFTRRPVDMLVYEQEVLRHAGNAGIGVILSGWGGDEVATIRSWGGWYDLLHQGKWTEAWREFRLGASPARNFPRAIASWVYDGRLRGPRRTTLSRQGYVPMPFITSTFSRRIVTDPDFAPGAWPPQARGFRTRCIANMTVGHLAPRMESWALEGASHGVTYRYPMLDRELVQFCLGIPPQQMIEGGMRRSLFRRAVKGVLPEVLRLQEKPKEPQRVARLGAANDAATELLAQRARMAPVRRLFDWIDYNLLERILTEPASDQTQRFIRRQAARVALLSADWPTS